MTLDGERVPIVGAQVDYGLNEIPRAQVIVPPGRDAYSGNISPAEAIMALTEPTRCQVLVDVTPSDGGVQKEFMLPRGGLIFDGYTDAPGASKSQSPPQAGITLMMQHWLADLNYSSVFSRFSHPANPSDYSVAAAYTAGSSTGPASQPGYRATYDVGTNLTEANIQTDLWDATIKPFLTALTRQEGFRIPGSTIKVDAANIPNDEAAGALGRIRSYPNLTPTALEANLAGMIRDDLCAAMGNNTDIANHTFWDMIVNEYAGEYLFAVVPRVDDALVVPYVAAARDYYKTIGGDELGAFEFGGSQPRRFQAFGVVAPLRNTTGADGGRESKRLDLGGWYRVPNRTKGIVKIERGPRWVGQGLIPSANDVTVLGRPVATADRPGAAGKKSTKVADAKEANARASRGFLEKYARTRLAYEQFLGRQGVVRGPLRMDVAPGSSVRIRVRGESHSDALSADFIGTVLRVSHSLSREGKTASTSLHLGHIRSAAENGVEGNSLAEHPLYQSAFLGAPLIGDVG
jgi:hypothetical protein